MLFISYKSSFSYSIEDDELSPKSWEIRAKDFVRNIGLKFLSGNEI